MTVNHNELFIEINFAYLAEKHGVRKGTIFYSDTFKSWVINVGQVVENLPSRAARFNGKAVQHVSIKSGQWCFSFDR